MVTQEATLWQVIQQAALESWNLLGEDGVLVSAIACLTGTITGAFISITLLAALYGQINPLEVYAHPVTGALSFTIGITYAFLSFPDTPTMTKRKKEKAVKV